MTPRFIDAVRSDKASHWSAIWWLLLLYRRPYHFRVALDGIPAGAAIRAVGTLVIHLLPYLLLATIFLRLISYRTAVFVAPWEEGFSLDDVARTLWTPPPASDILFLSLGVVAGAILGLTMWVIVSFASTLGTGLSIGLAYAVSTTIAVGTGFGIFEWAAIGISVTVTLAVPEVRSYPPATISGLAYDCP